MTDTSIPEGFVPLPRSSPLLDLLGPIYCRGSGLQLAIGLRADRRHANGRGTLHGGVLATLADVGMGYAMAFSSTPPLPLVTASMTLDYLGAVQLGEWLEVRLEHSKRAGKWPSPRPACRSANGWWRAPVRYLRYRSSVEREPGDTTGRTGLQVPVREYGL